MPKANTDKPIANIQIYRLDVYRLLTILLADKQIAKDKKFSALGNDFMESEANRLLALIALVSRQFLDFVHQIDQKKAQELSKRSCGELNFRDACNVIIHATDIAFYDFSRKNTKMSITNFEDTITITSTKKNNELQKTRLKFHTYATTCILLSNCLIQQETDHANE